MIYFAGKVHLLSFFKYPINTQSDASNRAPCLSRVQLQCQAASPSNFWLSLEASSLICWLGAV